MSKINADEFLDVVRSRVARADVVLETSGASATLYAETLSDLVDAVSEFDDWMAATAGKDIPLRWTQPDLFEEDDDTSTNEESPF